MTAFTDSPAPAPAIVEAVGDLVIAATVENGADSRYWGLTPEPVAGEYPWHWAGIDFICTADGAKVRVVSEDAEAEDLLVVAFDSREIEMGRARFTHAPASAVCAVVVAFLDVVSA